MTVTNTTARNQYTATAGQTVFAYTFEVYNKNDLVVLQNDTTLAEGTNYTVSGVGSDTGGNITLTSGATAGDIITVYRDMALERLTDYQNAGDFLAAEVNEDFDRLWLATQQNATTDGRAIRKPVSDLDSINMELPAAATRANKLLSFDGNGNVQTLSSTTNAATDAANVTYTATGTGAVGRTVQSRLTEVLSVKDFGAKGDGTTDDTAAIQAALDAGAALSTLATVVGAGLDYKVSSTLSVPFDVLFDGQGCTITPTMDDHVINIAKGGYVHNTVVDASGITFSNTKAAFRFNHTDNTQGHQNSLPVFLNCKAKLPSAATGTGFLINAASFYVQYLRMENLTVDRGNIGLHFQASGSTYCNGNSVDGLKIFDSQISAKFDYASGNTLTGIAAEENSYSAALKFSNNSSGNRLSGIRWDTASIEFDLGSDENYVDVMHSGLGASVTDNGRNNTVTFSGGRQVANTSVDHGNDHRGYIANPGCIEFRDSLAGGVSPYWTSTLDSGASIVYSQAFEGSASNNTQYTRKAELRSASSGTALLNFNNIPFVVPENNFRLHLVWSGNNTATNRSRIGVISTAGTSGIYFEKDNATYGDQNWRFVVKKAGTSTITDLGVANTSDQIWYATLEISDSKVFYGVGKYLTTASNDDGRVGRNTDAIWTTTRSTHVGQGNITTNIPDSIGLQPIVESEDATNAGKIELIDYHLIGGYRADNT